MRDFLPTPTIVSEPYWKGCREHVFRLQQCQSCGRYVFHPAYICHHCGSTELEWKDASGRGEVYSCTVVERQAGSDDEPYVVALIELEEGPVIMSNVLAGDPYSVAIGDRVRVEFEDASDEITLPVFVKEEVGN